MGRTRIEITGQVIASLTIPVRISDINYGNHLGNDALVSILHEARVSWLSRHGYSELNAAGTGLIMGDLAVEYISESFYGDLLKISLSAADISIASFDLFYKIETSRDGKNIIIAKAKTGMVCYDYERKKVAAVPDNLKLLLTNPL